MVTQGARGGTERNGTERDGADTASGSNGTNAGGNSNAGRTTSTYAVIFCHCSSTFIFSSSYSSSFLIIFFRQLQQQVGHERKEPDGQDGIYVGGNEGRDKGAGRHDCFFSYFSLFFISHLLCISFVANYSNRRGGAEWGGTRRDDAGGDSNAGRDGGQAGEGGGGRRREEGGLAGNMGTAEAEGQVSKGCERSNLEGQTAAEDEAGGRTGKSKRRPGYMAAVLPPPWLFGQGMENFFPKYNALQMI